LPFLPLLTAEDEGTPAVIARGRLYVTAGSERRRSSTYYTPPALTAPICAHTLEPQCYRGAAEGWPRAQWQLRPPAELLALKICDPACGAGAFLLQACRYLAARLIDAGGAAEIDAATARRLVATRCLYGVDKNPLAVEMAKLSLWLLAAQEEDPFTWLDHALRCGDSLIGLPAPVPATPGDRRLRPASAQAETRVLAELVPLHWPQAFPLVFADRGGFDAIVGNPPFLGGLRLSRELSHSYNLYLCSRRGTSRKADLVAHFIRRMYELLGPQGTLGFLSTKTATEGVTRKAGLWWVLQQGATIYRAQGPFAWPGAASVQAVVVHLRRGGWAGPVLRDGRPCAAINDQLATTAAQPNSQGNSQPNSQIDSEHRLRENKGLCYEGSVLLGTGFLVSPQQAQEWIASDPRNREVLFPYVSGKEFNHTPTLVPQRWAIRFGERSLEEARSYAAPFAHLLAHVYPERSGKNESRYPRMVAQWWKYWHERHVLYAAAARVRRVLIRSRVCARHMLGFVPATWVYGDAVIVFALDTYGDFALLQSSLHEAWAAHYTSTLRTDLRYVQSTCFETFARPAHTADLEAAGCALYQFRHQLMQARAEGLTAIYQRFHDPAQDSEDLRTLRTLQADLDHAVAVAYGWPDLDLGHAFHATRNGPRYTLGEQARRTVLMRLLALNHARHAAPQ
jgi:hypothetical protein